MRHPWRGREAGDGAAGGLRIWLTASQYNVPRPAQLATDRAAAG